MLSTSQYLTLAHDMYMNLVTMTQLALGIFLYTYVAQLLEHLISVWKVIDL